MGHAPSCLDEPLKPEQKVHKPPWIGRYTGREYTGKPEWWADISYTDPLVRKGIYRGNLPRFQEEDVWFFDPPVPDGESLSGAFGKDSRYNANTTKKMDQPGEYHDFARKIMEGSIQYKQIAEKFDISKEHPGIAVSPTLYDNYFIPANILGQSNILPPSWIRHLGPRFWDKPINDGCIEKGLALAKYTAMGCFAYTVFNIRGTGHGIPTSTHGTPVYGNIKIYYPQLTMKNVLKEYARTLPIPCTLAVVYGVAICTSAKIRHKDDLYNYVAASSAAGVTLNTMVGNGKWARGIYLGLTTLFVGTIFQYMRVSQAGPQGKRMQQENSGYHDGPMFWKWFEHGSMENPSNPIREARDY